MYVSKDQAKEIRDQLTLHPNYIAVCPSPEMAAELKVIHGIPGDNIRVLACVMVAGRDIVVLSKRQYEYYSKKEQDILKKAGAVSENRHM